MIDSNSTDIERRVKRLIPQPFKQLVIGLLTSSFFGRVIQQNCSKSLLGGVFNFAVLTPNTAARVYFGIWEPTEIRFSKKYVKEGDLVVELGSSIGVTLSTLCNTRKLERYVAVEASPTASRLLDEVISLNVASDIVKIDAAIDYTGADTVPFMELSLTGSRLSNNNDEAGIMHQVKTIRLGDVVNRYIPEAKSFVLISDIEGAEGPIFDLDIKALDRCQTIICELEDTPEYSIIDQTALLEKVGFRISEYYGNVYVFEKIKLSR